MGPAHALQGLLCKEFDLICRWRFADKPEKVQAWGNCISEALPDADVRDVGRLLKGKGFQVFLRGQRLYAFKGLAGRMGPIGVHGSMLMIMAGEFFDKPLLQTQCGFQLISETIPLEASFQGPREDLCVHP